MHMREHGAAGNQWYARHQWYERISAKISKQDAYPRVSVHTLKELGSIHT